MADATPTAAGACLCGAVTFEVRVPAMMASHCHCAYCRRSSGAAFVTWVVTAEDTLTIRDDDGVLRWHQSSPQARRGFCSRCGSTMFFRSTLCPGQVDVTRANFRDDPGVEPTMHCFYEHKVEWVEIHDDLLKASADDPALAHFQAVPPAAS